jgi:Xaa-Pro aminopeptidase
MYRTGTGGETLHGVVQSVAEISATAAEKRSPRNRMNRLRLGKILLAIGIVGSIGSAGTLRAAEDEAKAAVLIGLPAEEFQSRRDRLREALDKTGRDWIVVLRGADGRELEGKFRQTNDFAYLTGLEAPSAFLVMTSEPKRETIYLPPVNPFRVTLEEDGPAPGEATAKRLGIARVESSEKLLGELFTAIADPFVRARSQKEPLVYALGVNSRNQETPEGRLLTFLREGARNTEFRELGVILAPLRKAKSPGEIESIRKAIAVTVDAQEEVIRSIRPGIREFTLAGKILGTFVSGGAMRAGFPSIVGSGPNSTIPHYFANLREIADCDLVVVDIGAEYDYYSADITRTYPAGGTFTPRQREVYQLVLDAQKAVETEMKPGVSKLGDMTRFTREFFARSSLRARDEAGDEQTMEHFFIHGLGHYLGMDVHDVGDSSVPVEVGEVFTIEPGLYIKSENIGIRIEDDYLMTDHGPEKLSARLPSDPDAIERKIAEARGESPK